jgi:hypothetical protein
MTMTRDEYIINLSLLSLLSMLPGTTHCLVSALTLVQQLHTLASEARAQDVTARFEAVELALRALDLPAATALLQQLKRVFTSALASQPRAQAGTKAEVKEKQLEVQKQVCCVWRISLTHQLTAHDIPVDMREHIGIQPPTPFPPRGACRAGLRHKL